MFKHYILGYIRSLLRNRFISIINISGLIIGLSGCFIMLLFVLHEISMDNFQQYRKTVYRVLTENRNPPMKWSQAAYLFGPAAKQEFPEVKEYARLLKINQVKVKYNDQYNEESGFQFADPSLLKILTFHLISGNPANVIAGFNNILLSQHMSSKYFGELNPVGKSLLVSIKGEELVLTVTGVFEDLPENSSVQIDFLGNIEFGKKQLLKMLITYGSGEQGPPQPFKDSWDHNFYTNLIQVNEHTDIKNLETRLNKSFSKYLEKEDQYTYSFQRYDQMYLQSEDLPNDDMKHGKKSNIWIFGANAVLILIIACFNYLILALAQSENRAKEIGIRKVCGAGFKNLSQQIILESFAFACLCLPLAIGLSELLLPILNNLLDKHLVIHYTQNLVFLAGILLITMLISLFSGLYLAVYLNKFNPMEILRGRTASSGTHSHFLKSLVIMQIAIFIGLIISSLIIFHQLAFIRNFDTGFQTENVLTLRLDDESVKHNYIQLRHELETLPEIKFMAKCLFVPPSNSRMMFGMNRLDNPSKQASIEALLIDFGFVETMGIKLKEGHAFSPDFPSDSSGVILNEAAVQELGMKETLGTKLPFGTVIGIAKNFHLHDLHSKIAPAIMMINPQFFNLILKTRVDPKAVIPKIKKIWDRVNPDTRFNCQTLEDMIADQYLSERRFSGIILLFTILAILVASLGLIGLSGFITIRRTKEIGIRKVNGATVFQMVLLFWKEIILWTVLAFLLAGPIAWYCMHRWLENFAYQTPIYWWIFAEAGILAMLIALISVSWQVYKVSIQNPVKALRYE